MRATKKIANRLNDHTIEAEAKQILGDLVNALDQRDKMDMSQLFKLSYEDFELVIKLLVDWRLQQYRKPPGGLQQAILEPLQETNHFH